MYVLNVGPASVVLTANVEKLLRSEEFVGDMYTNSEVMTMTAVGSLGLCILPLDHAATAMPPHHRRPQQHCCESTVADHYRNGLFYGLPSPDCLPILLSMSSFYFLVFLFQ